MNEFDVREILRLAADAPPTPVRDLDTMITLVHRAQRRRAIGWTSAGAAVLAVVAVVSLAIGAGVNRAAPVPGAVSASTEAPPAPSTTSPHPPPLPGGPSIGTGTPSLSAGYDLTHAQQLLYALSELVPAGFTLPTEDVFTDGGGHRYQLTVLQAWPDDGSPGDPVVTASTEVYRDGRQAAIAVTVVPVGPVPANLCAAQIRHQGTENGCHVVAASNGVRIRVAWRDLTGYGRIWYATRYFADRSLTVQQTPSGIRPDLPAYGPVWSETALAEAAAAPSLASAA